MAPLTPSQAILVRQIVEAQMDDLKLQAGNLLHESRADADPFGLQAIPTVGDVEEIRRKWVRLAEIRQACGGPAADATTGSWDDDVRYWAYRAAVDDDNAGRALSAGQADALRADAAEYSWRRLP